jgi:hypothetical protein
MHLVHVGGRLNTAVNSCGGVTFPRHCSMFFVLHHILLRTTMSQAQRHSYVSPVMAMNNRWKRRHLQMLHLFRFVFVLVRVSVVVLGACLLTCSLSAAICQCVSKGISVVMVAAKDNFFYGSFNLKEKCMII